MKSILLLASILFCCNSQAQVNIEDLLGKWKLEELGIRTSFSESEMGSTNMSSDCIQTLTFDNKNVQYNCKGLVNSDRF